MFRRKSTTEKPKDLSFRDPAPQQGNYSGYTIGSPAFHGQLPSLRDAVGGNFGIRPPSPSPSLSSYGGYPPSSATSSRGPYTPFGSPTFPFGTTTSPSTGYAPSPQMAQDTIPRRASVSQTYDMAQQDAFKRRAKRKTVPECCHVCAVVDTPEWRKGPSGLRTLCNACGLVGSKLNLGEPTSIGDVVRHLESIGRARFRDTQYRLPPGAAERASASWVAPESSSKGQRSSRAKKPVEEDYEAAKNLQMLASMFAAPTSNSSNGFSTYTPPSSAAFPSGALYPPQSPAPSYTYTGSPSYPFTSSSTPNSSLDTASRRLSAMSMDEKDPPAAATSSSRMDLASLMNRPPSRSSNRRLSFGGSSNKSSGTFSF